MTTLENLYYGNISPVKVQYTKGSEYDNALKLVLKNDSALMSLGERESFIRGFSPGVNIIVEAMNNGKN